MHSRFLQLGAAYLAVSTAYAQDVEQCPGYTASNVTTTESSLTASLTLAGTPCNVYGNDTQSLTLEVTYETGKLKFLRFIVCCS